MFLIVGVEDVKGIAIRDLGDLAGEGVGEGRVQSVAMGALVSLVEQRQRLVNDRVRITNRL
ncbi:MAG: hypothetical protein ACE10A_02365 [Acidiferrobacterales bacterium]